MCRTAMLCRLLHIFMLMTPLVYTGICTSSLVFIWLPLAYIVPHHCCLVQHHPTPICLCSYRIGDVLSLTFIEAVIQAGHARAYVQNPTAVTDGVGNVAPVRVSHRTIHVHYVCLRLIHSARLLRPMMGESNKISVPQSGASVPPLPPPKREIARSSRLKKSDVR